MTQNCGVAPKYRASRKAVSAVTDRRRSTISFKRVRGRRKAVDAHSVGLQELFLQNVAGMDGADWGGVQVRDIGEIDAPGIKIFAANGHDILHQW